MSFTSWDARVLVRALQIAALGLLLAWLLTAATDEGGIAWGVRVGRALPLAPVCAAVGAWLALAPARARGEVRALEAMGRTPWQNARGAVLGASSVAAIAAAAIAWAPPIDVTGFYPVIPHGDAFVVEDGAFVDPVGGVRIEANGAPTLLPKAAPTSTPVPAAPRAVPPAGRAAAGLATLLAGLALPMIAAWVRRGTRAVMVLGVTTLGLATVLLFQAAAAMRVPALVAVVPPALLLALAVTRYRGGAWKSIRAA